MSALRRRAHAGRLATARHKGASRPPFRRSLCSNLSSFCRVLKTALRSCSVDRPWALGDSGVHSDQLVRSATIFFSRAFSVPGLRSSDSRDSPNPENQADLRCYLVAAIVCVAFSADLGMLNDPLARYAPEVFDG